MSHLQTAAIDKYLLKRLGKNAIARTECHLLVCESCRTRTDETAFVIFTLQNRTEPRAMAAG